MANEYSISWSVPSGATLNANNNYQLTADITLTHYPGKPFPNSMTVDIVVGNTTSSTEEAFDSITVTPGTGSTYKFSYTLTATKYASLFESTSPIKVYARIKTKYGAFYSTIKSITLDAPPVILNPTFVSNFASDNSVFIAGITNLTARCAARGQFGATVGMVFAYTNGSTSGSVQMIPDDDGFYRSLSSLIAGDYRVGLIATDSRGATSNYSVTIPVKEHIAPNLSYEIFRCDSNGDRDMSGAYISVTAWSIANPSELGIASITVQGVETGTATEIIPQTALTEGVASIFGGSLSPDKSYTLTLTAADNAQAYGAAAQTATQVEVVPKVVRVINVKDGGTGLAFGMRATKDNIVDSAWEIDAPTVRPASLSNFYPSVNAVSGSWSRVRCSATVSEAPSVMTNDDKTIVYIAGRMRLTSFTRNDANPGISAQTSLRPSKQMSFDCGVRFTGTAAAPEKMQATLTTAGVLTITTTETLSNISGNTFYALFFDALLPLA